MGLAIIFSGQGNQYPEMYARFQQELNLVDLDSVSAATSVAILPRVNLDNDAIFLNQYAQPLIAGYEYLVWQKLKDILPAPVAMAGYSLGEITAIAAATNLTLEELLKLTKMRAELMYTARPSGLLAVSGLHLSHITALLEQTSCYMAIRSSLQNFIVGGYEGNLAQLIAELSKLPGVIHYQYLKVEVAAHTPLLNWASIEFHEIIRQYYGLKLQTRIVSSIDASVQYYIEPALDNAAKQLSSMVNFEQLMQVLFELGATTILEIGPGKAIQNIIRQSGLPVKIRSIDDFNTLANVAVWVEKSTL